MVDNSNMPHPKCLGSQKNPGTEPKTCEKGPKLGLEYLPTSKTLHCVRTACMAFPMLRVFPHNLPPAGCSSPYMAARSTWTTSTSGRAICPFFDTNPLNKANNQKNGIATPDWPRQLVWRLGLLVLPFELWLTN